ncbi:MAG TPA: alkaline phosphatase family protein [Chloroflexota bacterium]|nr:alkaline phosphatase family protein [Chloroflexota bacterium]
MRKVYVVGFDGASWRFIEPLLQRGEMPNFQRLINEGTHGKLKSTVPFHSAPAWVSFMTGKNSGKHGIYMFQDYDALSYTYVGRTANSRYYAGQTLFDVIGEMGGSVAAIRVPMSFPAWPVNGIMISGFPTPGDTPESYYPPELLHDLGAIGEADPPDFRLLTVDEQIETLERHMARMEGVIGRLMEKPYDLFMVVHRVPDPVHHFFIGFVDPRTPVYNADDAQRYGDVVNRFYRRMDSVLGEMLQRIGPEDTLFVISDHGGAITPPRQLNLNVWLAQQGLLTPQKQEQSPMERLYALNQRLLSARVRSALRRRAPKAVKGELRGLWQGLQGIDFAKTRAYHFPMKNPPLAGIVINVKGRQPQGIVEETDYEPLREQLIHDLRELRDPNTGEPVVREVYRREDLYHGPYVERAPDLVVWCHDMYKEGPLAAGPVVGQVPFDELQQVPGSHDEWGIFLAKGPGIAAGKEIEGAQLIDVTPTVLHAMELAVPADMDGRVLTDIFTGEREIESVEIELARKSAESHLSEDEEQLIKDKLKGWGYM